VHVTANQLLAAGAIFNEAAMTSTPSRPNLPAIAELALLARACWSGSASGWASSLRLACRWQAPSGRTPKVAMACSASRQAVATFVFRRCGVGDAWVMLFNRAANVATSVTQSRSRQHHARDHLDR